MDKELNPSPQEAAPGAVGVTLTWAKNGAAEGSVWADLSELGFAYLIEPASRVFSLERKLFLSEYGPDDLGMYPTLEAAKEFALSDLRQRLAPFLTTLLPSGQNETGGEVPREDKGYLSGRRRS